MHEEHQDVERDTVVDERAVEVVATTSKAGPTTEAIQAWMVSKLAEALEVPAGEIDVHKPLTRYSLDSIQVFMLTGDLADWLQRELPATILWEHPTIATLAQHLAEPTE